MVYQAEVSQFDEARMAALMNSPCPPGTVHSLLLSGMDGPVGLPLCCAGPSVYVNLPPNIPEDIEAHVSHEEYARLIGEVNSALHASHVPICPLGCIPFAVVCGVVCTRAVRTRTIRAAVARANQRLAGRPVKWLVSQAETHMYFAGVTIAYLILEDPPSDALIPTAHLPSVVALHTEPVTSTYNDYYSPYVNCLFQTTPPSSILTLCFSGSDGLNGWPKCCCRGAMTPPALFVDPDDYLGSQQLSRLDREALNDGEVLDFLEEFNSVLQSTLFPVAPCVLFHFLLPTSPVCALVLFKAMREQGTNDVIERANAAIAARGYHWEKSVFPTNMYAAGVPALHLVKNATIAAVYLRSLHA